MCVCSGVSSRHVLAGRTDAVQTVSARHVPGRLRSNAVSGVWAGHHDHPRRSHRLPALRRQRSVTHSHQRCCCCCCGRWRFQRHRPLRRVDSVRLQILLMGTWFMVCPMARPHYHDMSLDWHRLFTTVYRRPGQVPFRGHPGPHQIHVIPCPSPQRTRHFDQFSRFGTTHGCDQPTRRCTPTDTGTHYRKLFSVVTLLQF